MSDLHEILRDGVPEAPPLVGLAGAAERAGRRRRARRRTAWVGAACLAVAAPFVVGAALAGDEPAAPPAAQPTVSPTPVVDTSCRDVAPRGPAPDDAVYIRFCAADSPGAAYVPDTVLTVGVGPVVNEFQHFGIASCRYDWPPFRIQLGRPDGSAVTLDNILCGHAYDVLLEAIGAQEAEAVNVDLYRSATCADHPESVDSVDTIARLPVTSAILCGPGPDDHRITAGQGDKLRILTLRTIVAIGNRCAAKDPGPSTRLVLTLADGSLHQVTYSPDPCGFPVSVDRGALTGSVGASVNDLLERLRP